jgi:hypothetical protein
MPTTDDKVTLLTPKARCSYVQLLSARAFEDNPEPKFSVLLIFDKTAQSSPEFKRMVQAYTAEKARLYPNGAPSGFKTPFRPSSEKEGFPPDCVFISISTTRKPDVVDADGTDLFEPSKVYSGMYGRASLSLYSYDKKGNKGIAFGLNNFQKLGDGERMDSKTSAAEDFGLVSKDDSQVDLDAILNA